MTGTPFPELAEAGLLLQGCLPLESLDERTTGALLEAGHDLGSHSYLVLLGQAGTMLWDRSVATNRDGPNPFDNTVLSLVAKWFEQNQPEAQWEAVYPSDIDIPLGSLAELVGWGKASPLGLTVNPIYGLWLAHRIVFLTDLELASSLADQSAVDAVHPCHTCIDQPCISSCPVGAVSMSNGYDVATCAHHRIAPDTACSHQCLARNACPVGTEHRYGQEQMVHHYGAGLASIVAWLGPDDS